MRFAPILPLLATVASSAVAVSPLNRAVAARQAHPAKRDLLDVCAALDVDLVIDDPLTRKPLVLGHLELCLCVSVLPSFIHANLIAEAAVALAGEAIVLAELEALIKGDKSKEHCSYPPHATPFCSFTHPCSFDCTDGFKPSPAPPAQPTSCVCPAPLSVCNGKCGSFPHGCGSQGVSKMRREERCDAAKGEEVCGVVGGKGWDCIQTVSDLESCGGCTIPSPFSNPSSFTKVGTDCTAIPNVDAVSCIASRCAVKSCKGVYAVNAAGDACELKSTTKTKRDIPVVGAVANEAVGAVIPGLLGVAEVGHAGAVVARDIPIVGAVANEAVGAVVPGLLGVAEIGNVGAIVARDIPIVGAVANEAVGAVVPGLLGVAEVGHVGAIVAKRDIPVVGAVANEAVGAIVPGLVGVAEVGNVGAIVAKRDIPIVGAVANEAVGAIVPGLLGVAEVGHVGAVVARDIPIVGAVANEAIGAVVPGVLGVAEVGHVGAIVAKRDIPIVGAVANEAVGAVVPGLLGVAEVGHAAAVVARDIPIVGAVANEAVAGVVPGLLGVAEVGHVGAIVARDIPIVGAEVNEVVNAVVPGLLGVAEVGHAAAVVARDIPIVGAVANEAVGAIVPGVLGVAEIGNVGAAVL